MSNRGYSWLETREAYRLRGLGALHRVVVLFEGHESAIIIEEDSDIVESVEGGHSLLELHDLVLVVDSASPVHINASVNHNIFNFK